MLVEFCIPVYNEEKILKNNILKLFNFCRKQNFSFDWKIVVAINGTTDKSLFISQELARNNPKRISVFNINEPGKGRAIKTYVNNSGADIIVYMDVDLAVSLKNINEPSNRKKINMICL